MGRKSNSGDALQLFLVVIPHSILTISNRDFPQLCQSLIIFMSLPQVVFTPVHGRPCHALTIRTHSPGFTVFELSLAATPGLGIRAVVSSSSVSTFIQPSLQNSSSHCPSRALRTSPSPLRPTSRT